MNLTREILKEHGSKQAHKIARYASSSPLTFKLLIDTYLTGPYRVTQRASWPISIVGEAHPKLIRPHLKKLLDFMVRDDVHDAVKRNTMRVLQFVEIPKRNHAQVIDICFELLQSKREAVAIKCFAMTVLSRVIDDKPELQRELKIILEDQLPYSTAAFKSRATKLIKRLPGV
ncbi:hypothetical protein [Pseudochryseolinea flava]|uniref:HEAT repeat domain-containing protein n=1 Tax=Pseudochryseolinea flava TaxID=2059302 RepID=A0A364XX89_9BACT|nr:hypothetical protein [Pseudochryseolinea flava]RAV98023.1 hypothetical protein DQQ10_25815 [Pseudochryseolinea flava]